MLPKVAQNSAKAALRKIEPPKQTLQAPPPPPPPAAEPPSAAAAAGGEGGEGAAGLGGADVLDEFTSFDLYALRDQLAKKKVKTLSFFQEIDKDGSGELTKKEFGKAIRDLGFETVPKSEIDAVFDQLDPDRSGKISYEELYKILQSLPKKQRSEEGGPAQAPPPLTKQKTSSKQLKRKE